MKKLLTAMLFLAFAAPLARADNVTVHGTVGLLEAQLVNKELEPVGRVEVWNTAMDMNVVVSPAAGYLLSKVYVYMDTEPPPPPEVPTEPDFGEWPFGARYKTATAKPYELNVHLADLKSLEWGLWGEPWLQRRLVTVAVCVELKSTDAVPVTFRAWALNPNVPVENQRTGWGDNTLAIRYELQHPKHGTFVGPVHGLGYATPTHVGTTGVEAGGFSFYPGEVISFDIGGVYVGSAAVDQNVSPLDLFPSLEASDPAAANLARLLLSLDADGQPKGAVDIRPSAALLPRAMADLGMTFVDFGDTGRIDQLIARIIVLGTNAGLALAQVPAADAVAWVEQAAGSNLMRRNVSKSPEYAVDKPKLDIMPVWVAAKKANGEATTIEYRDKDGNVVETRDKAKPLFVTYTEEQNLDQWGLRRASDIITAVSLDDGATWKRFNVSRMARHSSFTLEATGERFPGDSRAPQQKIAENKILVVWTSAYARGGKPVVSIKTDDDYPYDDAYAVRDVWGVRGTQGSVDYDLDPDVGDQGIGEIPYHAMWACRGVLVTAAEHAAGKFLDTPAGEIVWFKPERLTTGRRDAFLPVVGSAKNAGFAVAWQEDPGGLRPGQCSSGGHGWSGATVHKKTDIWYSFVRWADFDRVDSNFVATDHSADEHGEDSHSQAPEISNRPKWLVPMSLPVRVSDNNTVNTDNLKVQLDAAGLPVVLNGSFVPLAGAEETDWVRHDHEHDGDCGSGDVATPEEPEHDGEGGNGGGWGMARYAYMLPELEGLADTSGANVVWDGTTLGEYRPGELPGCRWYRFVNQPGVVKTVAITPDGRVLDGDTGAGRPVLTLTPYAYTRPDGKKVNSAWAILAYEETKGLGTPPDEDHQDLETVDAVVVAGLDEDDDEIGEKGKDVVYHSFRFDQPDMVSAGNVVNLPALDDAGNLIPIFYKDATGAETAVVKEFARENARRPRVIAQPKKEMGSTRTPLVVLYKQGREGNGKPSDIFAVRAVVPGTDTDTDNPYRFSNLIRYDSGSEAPDPNIMRYQRRHMNMTSATVEATDPTDIAVNYQGQPYAKVARWKQEPPNLSDESFANPYSDAKGHRGFIDGDRITLGYSFTPNWGRLGGDHLDFYVRRSFDGGRTWTTDPNSAEDAVHTVIEKDPDSHEWVQKQYRYGPGQFEPGRNVSLLKGNKYTVTDPRLVPPMGPGTMNPTYPQDDTYDPDVYYVAFGTAEVIHGLADPRATDTVKADIFYTRTTDGGTTWEQVPWVINPESASPEAGETVYRWPWLAQGTPHQGHAQIRMHPSGTRLYAIWHQFTDGDEEHVSPHDVGNDIWFRRIDYLEAPAP